MKEEALLKRKRLTEEKYERKKMHQRNKYWEKKKRELEGNDSGNTGAIGKSCTVENRTNYCKQTLKHAMKNKTVPNLKTRCLVNESDLGNNDCIKSVVVSDTNTVTELHQVQNKKPRRNSAKKLTLEEKRRKEREKKQKQRAKIYSDPVQHQQFLLREAENYQKRKKAGKLKMINEKSKREQRIQRRRWIVNARNYRNTKKKEKNEAAYLAANSPPPSPPNEPENLIDVRSISRRRSLKNHKLLKIKNQDLETKNVKLQRALERYKKKYYRMKNVQHQYDSPNAKVKNTFRKGTEAIKKRLKFAEVLSSQIKYNMSTASPTEKKIIAKMISGDYIKKHRVTYQLSNFLSLHQIRQVKKRLTLSKRKRLTNKIEELKRNITLFYENDENSSISPGKKGC